MRLVRRKVRKPEPYGKLELERVIGLTSSNAGGLACNSLTGDIAYLAGAVVVVYNVTSNKQTNWLTAPRAPKPLSCVAYSHQGGKFICAGESGHQPAVVVWDSSSGASVADLKSHKYGIQCVEFSPNGKHLVSVGVPHDGYLCLWEWRTATVIIRTRTSAIGNPTAALRFSSDGSFFLTAGSKHIKHWVVGPHAARSRTTGAGNLALEGRPVKLGSQKEASFASLSCAGPTKETGTGGEVQPFYGLTVNGILCLLHFGLAVEKWVDLKVRQGHALSISETHVACACSDGIVRFFMKGSLAYSTTLPKPAPIGYHGLTDNAAAVALAAGHHPPSDVKFPDAVACSFVSAEKLAVIYGDHTLIIWDIQNVSKIERHQVFLAHNSCVWDVATLPMLPHQGSLEQSRVNEGAFATCSTDGSIRLWCISLGSENDESDVSPSTSLEGSLKNIYSKEVLGVLYSDAKGDQKDKCFLAGSEEDSVTQGFRSICISSDGHHLAAGDQSGNLRIYDLSTLQLISLQEAHDAEILTLSYSKAANKASTIEEASIALLASGGRDRLIHIYDVTRDYDVIETLDDHSASITTVKFACGGSKLLSCSADKSVVFRNVAKSDFGCKSTRYHQESAPRGTIYDLDIDRLAKLVVTVGQDKKINILSLGSGKPVRSFKPDGDIGEPIKAKLDISGSYVVCSHSDKYMRLYDFSTGELLAQASGHAEVITGLAFLPDCQRLVSVSGDSCIFVWKLPINLSRMMRKRCIDDDELQPHRGLKSFLPRFHSKDGLRAAKIPKRLKQPIVEIYEGERKEYGHDLSTTSAEGSKDVTDVTDDTMQTIGDKKGGDTPAFKFSFSRLPSWAQAKVADEMATSGKPVDQKDETPFHSSESRWTERLAEGYKLFSESAEDITPPATIRASGFGARRRFSVDGASVESTPDSIAHSADVTPTSSPQGPPRKETVWKTVHTVFFNELDFLPEESPSTSGLPHLSGNNEVKDRPLEEIAHTTGTTVVDEACLPGVKLEQTSAEDDVVVYLSDNDEPSRHAALLESKSDGVSTGVQELVQAQAKAALHTEGDSSSFTLWGQPVVQGCMMEAEKDTQLSVGSSLESFKDLSDGMEGGHQLNLESHKSSLEDESVDEEEGGEEDSFVPADDLFSAHFDSLSSDLKVPSSTRSSFSARFLARTNVSSLRASLVSPGKEWGPPRNLNAVLQDSAPSAPTSRHQQVPDVPDQEVDRDTHNIQQNVVTRCMTPAECNQESRGLETDTGVREDLQGSSDGCGYVDDTPRSHHVWNEEAGTPKRHTISTPPLPLICAPDASPSSVFSFVMKGKDKQAYKQQICHKAHEQSENMEGLGVRQVHDDGDALDLKEVEPEWIRIGDPTPKGPPVEDTSSDASRVDLEALGMVTNMGECATVLNEMPSDVQLEMQGLAEHLEKKVCLGPEDVDLGAASKNEGATREEGSENQGSLNPPVAMLEPPKASISPPGLKLPRPKEEYKSVLQELLEATEKASRFFDELQDPKLVTSKSVQTDVLVAASTYQELMPGALLKVQRLAQQAATYNLAGEGRDPFLPSTETQEDDGCCYDSTGDNGSASLRLRSGVASSISLSESAIASVDIESFVMRYSTRFSETLASQVLALVHKELKANQQ